MLERAVKGQEINVMRIDGKEYISLTDLARYANPSEPKIPIYAWMRNMDVILYLGLWEKINNETFKGHEFETFKNEAYQNKIDWHANRVLAKVNYIIGQTRLADSERRNYVTKN